MVLLLFPLTALFHFLARFSTMAARHVFNFIFLIYAYATAFLTWGWVKTFF
jgi:hypothetical protein